MLNASLSLPGARLAPVSLVMRPAIRPVCTRHWGVCETLCAFVCLFLCVCVSGYTRFVHVLPLVYLKTCTVGEGKQGSARDTYSLAHYHVNALCFLSTCLCQTRGPLFSLPGLKRHSGQAPTWCVSALAQFTRSLAPQTRLLASSRFSPSVLASQQPRISLWERLHSETFNGWRVFANDRS